MVGVNAESTIWQVLPAVAKYLKQHVWLVAAIIAVGVLQAVLVKAPFLLLKELGDQLSSGTDGASSNWLFDGFASVKNWLLGLVGIPSGPDSDLGEVITGTSIALGVIAVLGAVSVYVYRVLAQFAAMRVVVLRAAVRGEGPADSRCRRGKIRRDPRVGAPRGPQAGVPARGQSQRHIVKSFGRP